MKTLYHGTTESNLNRIRKGLGKGTNPWRLGDSDKMYFVDLSKPESYKSEEIDPKKAIKKAFDQAKLQSCFNDDVDLYVLECEIPDELVEPDGSFEDAKDSQIDVDKFSLGYMTKIHRAKINKYLKPRIAMGMWENGCCNRNLLPIDLQEYINICIMQHSIDGDLPRHQAEDILINRYFS